MIDVEARKLLKDQSLGIGDVEFERGGQRFLQEVERCNVRIVDGVTEAQESVQRLAAFLHLDMFRSMCVRLQWLRQGEHCVEDWRRNGQDHFEDVEIDVVAGSEDDVR